MKIDTDVDMPSVAEFTAKDFMGQMNVGDSVYLPLEDMHRVHAGMRVYARRHNMKVSARTDANGKRVWRIA